MYDARCCRIVFQFAEPTTEFLARLHLVNQGPILQLASLEPMNVALALLFPPFLCTAQQGPACTRSVSSASLRQLGSQARSPRQARLARQRITAPPPPGHPGSIGPDALQTPASHWPPPPPLSQQPLQPLAPGGPSSSSCGVPPPSPGHLSLSQINK